MGILNRRNQPEAPTLDEIVDSLPKQVSAWTPEQRAAYTAASDRTMREQGKRETRRR